MPKHPEFIVHTDTPFNGEPPAARLREHFITPRELFYVRNHGPIPLVDPSSYGLTVDGMVERPLELSLDRIMNDFPRRTVMATLECAGNRRDELIAVAPIPGEVPWQAGAIGNTFWSGMALKEILNAAGVRPGAQYAAFMGLEEVIREGKNAGFGGSIPLDKAMGGEVLVAFEMNGDPLTPEHGYPLRLIVPGYIGARSVKWLARITIQAEPSRNYFQAHAYQLFPPGVNAETADWSAGLQLGELGVNAAICEPADGEQVSGDTVVVRGYAISGGRRIARVDVSSDGGKTWQTARLVQSEERWAWTFWEARLALRGDAARSREVEITARAFDAAANTQPPDPHQVWNFKGYMNNAWDRVRIKVRP
jgi:sulfite oxidase